MSAHGIELEALTFTYPGAHAPVLSDLSLSVAPGEAHAVLGASGAGKTTLLNLMSGILTPDSGRILVNGEDVTQMEGHARGVAQVFQFPVLYDTLTLRDNLAFPLRRSLLSAAAREARVRWMAVELGLEDVLDVKPPRLDLFQKQLTAVGKALIRPDLNLVLLDEPLTSVAPGLKWQLRGVLSRLRQESGLTMVYVTHDQTEALTFAERVSVLTAEGIVQTASPQALYETPANEFVAHFVGSPGMNLIDGKLVGVDVERIGFRSEWASLAPADSAGEGLSGRVVSVVPTGTRDGRAFGHVAVQLDDDAVISIEGMAEIDLDQSVRVTLDRYVSFENGERVSADV